MSIFGFDNNGFDSGIKDGDSVKVIFLERSFPAHYHKIIAEKEQKEKETADSLGIEPEPVIMSHKDGGLSWDFAVISRFNEDLGDYENTILYDINGNPVLPVFNIFGSYVQHKPEYIQTNNLGFSNIIKGGLDKTYNGSGNIIIAQHFPNSLPEKDWSTGMTADRITSENLEEYRELWHKETGRVANWNTIICKWNRLSEDRAIDKLEDMIASRLLLYIIDSNGRIAYVKPEKGMVFTAKVNKKGKFMDLLGFEWDKEATMYRYFCFGVDKVIDDDRELAEKLIELRNAKRALAVETVTVSSEFPDDETDVPF